MTDADRLVQLEKEADKGLVTAETLNVFHEIASKQADLLTKWVTSMNSYELEITDLYSPQKDRISLERFEDRIGQMKRSGRANEALDMAEVLVVTLHDFLDNQLRTRLQELVRVNDAAQTASARIIQTLMQQRKDALDAAAEFESRGLKLGETVQLLQSQVRDMSDELELMKFYCRKIDREIEIDPNDELLLEVRKLFVDDSPTQPAGDPGPINNNDGDTAATKQAQQKKKKGVGLMDGAL